MQAVEKSECKINNTHIIGGSICHTLHVVIDKGKFYMQCLDDVIK